jgi:hypothetical protein
MFRCHFLPAFDLSMYSIRIFTDDRPQFFPICDGKVASQIHFLRYGAEQNTLRICEEEENNKTHNIQYFNFFYTFLLFTLFFRSVFSGPVTVYDNSRIPFNPVSVLHRLYCNWCDLYLAVWPAWWMLLSEHTSSPAHSTCVRLSLGGWNSPWDSREHLWESNLLERTPLPRDITSHARATQFVTKGRSHTTK